MAQGKLKVKTKLPQGVKSGRSDGSIRKQLAKPLKKGSFEIKPKKAKLKEMNEMKKHMEKMLKKSIENDTVEKASTCEPRSLQILKKSM